MERSLESLALEQVDDDLREPFARLRPDSAGYMVALLLQLCRNTGRLAAAVERSAPKAEEAAPVEPQPEPEQFIYHHWVFDPRSMGLLCTKCGVVQPYDYLGRRRIETPCPAPDPIT